MKCYRHIGYVCFMVTLFHFSWCTSGAICPLGDVNKDCRVDMADLALMAEQWLTDGPEADINQDRIVDLHDYHHLSENWQKKVNRLIISEFLASNKNDLQDEDGDASDWIELYNMTAGPVNLHGWYLTDKAGNLTKWMFPSISIDAGDVMVVLASGKDRRDPSGPLHTNFALDKEGEYLALVKPDGKTIVHEYKPEFPEQFTDMSYGVPITGHSDTLVTSGAFCRYRVPAGAADLPAGWHTVSFDDAHWDSAVMGVGYDASGWGATPENLALGKPAAQSSDYSVSYPASNAVDGLLNTFSHTAGWDTNSTWQVNLGGAYYISEIVLYNRLNCCWARLRDITVSIRDPEDTTDIYVSELLNPHNILNDPTFLSVDFSSEPILGGIVRVHRTADPDDPGSNSDRNTLTLAEVDVLASASLNNTYSSLIETNVRNAMQHRNSSIFLRIPFTVATERPFDFLYLKARYDDGFAVYLNGVLAARRNAPADLVWNPSLWNAASTAENPKPQAILYETINLTPYAYLLREGRNVLAIHGLNMSADDEDFLMDVELIGVVAECGPSGYFKQPTPGQVNSPHAFPGRVEKIQFSHSRGYYDQPFDVLLSTKTQEAAIYYTIDGGRPTPEDGILYSGPVPITRTTCLRAVAVKSGYLSSDIETHTYIFPADVIHQPTLPDGFPAVWKDVSNTSYAADYEMDPRIVEHPNYSGQMVESLQSLPVISLVTDQGNLFDPSYGIYANPTQTAIPVDDGLPLWEVPASMEYFETDSDKKLQVNCGLRIQGGYFRRPSATAKHSFRLLFKREYGPGALDFPFFEYDQEAATRHNTLVLRAQGNDGYSWASMGGKAQYIRDEFGRRLQAAAGSDHGAAAAHGIFVHLYVNGLYWGLYNLVERPDAAFSAAYYGGEKREWDVFKHKNYELSEGTRDALNQMLETADYHNPRDTTILSNDAYWKLQGCNADGTRNPALAVLLDMDNFINYMLVNFWTGNQDWGWNDNNYWFGRYRLDGSTGFKFYCWDIEDILNSPRSPVTLDMIGKVYTNDRTLGRLHNRLMSNTEYRLRFGDHAHKHLFNNGVMTTDSASALYRDLADQVESAIVAESARWGDQHATTPWTQAHWRTERDYILMTYLPQRPGIVLQQLIHYGLYPSVDAPVFHINGTARHDGPIPSGAELTMESSVPGAVIWFTLDGPDPRRPGGEVCPEAMVYAGPIALTETQTVKARALSGGQWSALNEALYTVDPLSVDAW